MQDTRTAIARLESSEGDSSGVAAIAGWIAGSSNTNSTLRRNELLEPTAAVTRNVGPPAGSWTSTVAGAGAGAETLQIRSRLSSITCTFTPLFNQILRIILDQLASTSNDFNDIFKINFSARSRYRRCPYSTCWNRNVEIYKPRSVVGFKPESKNTLPNTSLAFNNVMLTSTIILVEILKKPSVKS